MEVFSCEPRACRDELRLEIAPVDDIELVQAIERRVEDGHRAPSEVGCSLPERVIDREHGREQVAGVQVGLQVRIALEQGECRGNEIGEPDALADHDPEVARLELVDRHAAEAMDGFHERRLELGRPPPLAVELLEGLFVHALHRSAIIGVRSSTGDQRRRISTAVANRSQASGAYSKNRRGSISSSSMSKNWSSRSAPSTRAQRTG